MCGYMARVLVAISPPGEARGTLKYSPLGPRREGEYGAGESTRLNRLPKETAEEAGDRAVT